MPVLTEKEALDGMLCINYITIRWPYNGDTPAVGFSYSCKWTENTERALSSRGIMSWMLAVKTAYILAENDPEPDLLTSRHERTQGGNP